MFVRLVAHSLLQQSQMGADQSSFDTATKFVAKKDYAAAAGLIVHGL